MLFAKRTAIIEIIFAATVNPPPSLSLSAAVSPPFSPVFSLFCVNLAFSAPPLIPFFLLPHSIPIAFVTSSFLFLCLLVAFLFLQHFNVISLLFLLFLRSLVVSFSLPLSHTERNSLCLKFLNKLHSLLLRRVQFRCNGGTNGDYILARREFCPASFV